MDMLQLLNELQDAVLKEDFYKANEVIEKIKREENAFEYVEPILELMEENPDLDFGIPGPTVHFVELYYKNGYEDLLLKSVKRQPTSQTVWMINRILNDCKLIEREKYLSIFEEILQKDEVSANIKEETKKFLEYQRKKNK